MKAVKARLEASLARPDPDIRFYLFHGPDEAGSRALALKLLKGLGDAEKFVVLGQTVRGDPASLADEAGAMALFGGKRAIWIEPAGDEISEGVGALLDATASESAVVALAGPLRRGSSLLKLAEAHPRAFSHISYVPDSRQLERIIVEQGRERGLVIQSDVGQRLVEACGLNQAIAAQELDKFALYLGAAPERPRPLDHDTVDAIGAECAEADVMRLGDIAMAGRVDQLIEELGRLPAGGADAIPIVRALQRRLTMIAPLRARVERGERPADVMASLGKSLFWKDVPLVQRMISGWSAQQIAEASARVAALERQLFGLVPGEAALGETLVTLGRVAARAR